MDGNHFVASLANPANETYRFQLTADGLLADFWDPKNNLRHYSYDLGLLR